MQYPAREGGTFFGHLHFLGSLSFLGCFHFFCRFHFQVVFIFMDIFNFQFNSIQSNSNLSVAQLSSVPMLCVLYVGTVPTLCILYVGTVPTLCISNVGTVPTFSPSKLVPLFDLHYLSLRSGPPQWPPQPCRQRAQRRRGPKIVIFSRTICCSQKCCRNASVMPYSVYMHYFSQDKVLRIVRFGSLGC